MVSNSSSHVSRPTPTSSGRLSTPNQSPDTELASSRLDCLGRRWNAAGISESASNLLALSWRQGTSTQYESALKQWCNWCGKQKVDSCSPTIVDVINFLASEHSSGKAYSTINSYRSALSSVIPPFEGHSVGQHPCVVRLMKGIFKIKIRLNLNTVLRGMFLLF